MKIVYQDLDEKLLKPGPQEPYCYLNSLRELIKQQKQPSENVEPDEALKIEQNRQMMVLLQKLVECPLFSVTKIPLSYIKDIFNAVGERLDNWKSIENTDELILLLQAGSMMASTITSERIENSKCINEIISQSQDIRAIILSYELLNYTGLSRRITHESADKISYLAVAQNLLRSPEHHFTLLDIVVGKNKLGETIIGSDLIFEMKSQPQGLNDRNISKETRIPREKLLDMTKTAGDLAKEICQQCGSESDSLKAKLEAKILWLRFIKDEESLSQAALYLINAIVTAYNFKNEIKHHEYASYLKDYFLKEAVELLQTSCNKTLLIKLMLGLNKLILKDGNQLMPLDYLTTVDAQRASSEDDDNPILIKLLQDLSSITIEEDGISFTKSSNTKIINSEVIKSSFFQYCFLNTAQTILRNMQGNPQRQNATYNQFANKVIESTIKIIEDCPTNNVYAFNPKITQLACILLKIVARPRNEEQFSIIKKLESKIIYETNNIDRSFTTAADGEDLNQDVEQKERQLIIRTLLHLLSELITRDQQNVGMSRRLMETEIVNNLSKVLELNTDARGALVDDFIGKYIMLIGTMCSDNPALTPQLIKNGIFEAVIKSIESRIPVCADILDSLVYSIHQMSLHEEGQKLIVASSIFKKILDKFTDPKICSLLPGELQTMKIFMSNLFDRSPAFKDIAKIAVEEQIEALKKYTTEQTAKYFDILRKEDLTFKQQQEQLQEQIRQQPQYQQMAGALSLINVMTNLSNERAVSRHTQDIMTEANFKNLFELYEHINQNPCLNDMSAPLNKVFRSIIECSTFPQNVAYFIERFKYWIEALKQTIGEKKIHQLEYLDFTDKTKTVEGDLEPLDQYNPSEQSKFLTKGEKLLTVVNTIQGLARLGNYFHTATLIMMFQNEAMLKVAKTLYYLLKLYQKAKIEAFTAVVNENKLNGPFTKEVNMSYKEYQAMPAEEKKVSQRNINELLAVENFQVNNKSVGLTPLPEFKLKENVLNDFFTKMSQISYQNQRQQAHRQAQETNILYIGKLLSKNTRQFIKLGKESENTLDQLNTLFSIYTQLLEISPKNKQMLEGAAFYSFFKNKGVKNLIDVFKKLANQDIDETSPALIVEIHTSCCNLLKEFFINLINGKSSETHINSILLLNMGTDFDSPKHFYQNVYHTLCSSFLPLDEPEANPIEKLMQKKNSQLLDVIISLLQNASKSFQNCQLLKESQAHRNEREQRRGGRNQADQGMIQTIIDMGFGFNRDRIVQALLQSQNNIDNAVNLLFEWQAQQESGIIDAPDQNLIDSSDESIAEIDSAFMEEGSQQQKVGKITKIGEPEYLDILKKSQQLGFKWMIQAKKCEETSSKSYIQFFTTVLLNEKGEAEQKSMFTEIFKELFEKNLFAVQEQLQHVKAEEACSEDLSMEDQALTANIIKSINRFSDDLQLIQRLMNNNKVYHRLTLKQDVFSQCIKLYDSIIKQLENKPLHLKILADKQLYPQYQRLLFDMSFLFYTFVQLTQMQIATYQANTKQELQDTIAKKIQSFKKAFDPQYLFQQCIRILSLSDDLYSTNKNQPQLKEYLTIVICALALRILMDPDINKSEKHKNVLVLFKLLMSLRKHIQIDQKIMQTLSILLFENDDLIQQQSQLLTQRVLLLKYEHETKLQNPSAEQGPYVSKCSFNNFLQYFQQLSSRNQDTFKKILGEYCELKSVKKANAVSQDLATIKLKEPILNENKKQILKDRAILKQVTKSIDFAGDKQLKTQVKASKRALAQQLPEELKGTFQALVSTVAERTQEYQDDFNQFLTFQQKNEKYLLNKAEIQQINNDDKVIIETIFKLCQAYPQYTTAVLTSSPQTKKSFIQWFIKDYIPSKMLSRSIIDVPNPAQEENAGVQQAEITFKLKFDLNILDSFLIKGLNSLTGYNHLMSLNEQVVKHEIRTKFVLEALSQLQKAIKDKSQHQWKQKCLIISSLMVINALTNFTSTQIKHQVVTLDNFHNSIRACILRDSTTKDSNLPNSFIKIANDLITEVVDVSLPSNSDIINKCITNMKVLAEFIHNEKKKEEKLEKAKLNSQKLEEVKEQPGEQQQNVDVQMDQPVVAQDNYASDHDNMEIDDQQQLAEEESLDDDEEDQEHNEDDDADENEEDEDDNQDEEDEDDDEGMFEEQDDDDEGDIELVRQEADHDMFGEDDLDEDEEEIIREGEELWGRQDGDRRAPRVLDIININNAAVQQQAQRQLIYRGGRLGQADQRRQDWTEEEEEVQRILSNMRGIQSQFAARDRNARHQPPPPYGGRQPVPADDKKGVIESIFEGLKLISEKELFDIIQTQRQQYEADFIQTDKAFKSSVWQNEILPDRRINYIHQQIEDAVDLGHDFAINLGHGGGMGGGPFQNRFVDIQALIAGAQGIQFHGGQAHLNNPFLLDPMFARPNPFLQDFREANNDPVADIGSYNNHLRSQQAQISQNQNDALGQQLLQSMHVEAEEEKKDPVSENKPPAFSASSNSSNEQLLNAFFNRQQNDAVIQEFDQERDRVSEQSRLLNEQIERQRQDLQNIIQSQARMDLLHQQIEQQSMLVDQMNNQVNEMIVPQQPVPVQQPPVIAPEQQQQEPVEEHIIVEQQQQEQPVPENIEVREEAQPVVQEEEKQAEVPQQVEESKQESSGKTFGYDNELLLANGIDPSILHELPEELRVELLSTIDIQHADQNQQQQPSAQQQQQNPAEANEERKDDQQQPAAQQQQQQQNLPEYYAIAQELGLDPEFLDNLPEEMRNELIQQAQLQQAPPQREPEQMDLASFIATVNDPNLRREIFMNMDEATINSLPPNLMAEARGIQNQLRYERGRLRDNLEAMGGRMRGLINQAERDDAFGAGLFGRRYGGQREEPNQAQSRNLEDAINQRQNQLCEETSNEDILHSLTHQLAHDEKILESLLLILLTNQKVDCELIPCLNALIKIQNSNGIAVLRNKFINAVTFILKAISLNDDESLKLLFGQAQIKKKQSALILIGSLRLLLKTNRSLMKYILKGLVVKEETQQLSATKSTQVLKKQMKAMSIKSSPASSVDNLSSSIDEGSASEQIKTASKTTSLVNIIPPLAEIFYLIRADVFRKDKALIRNLSLLIHQILKQFDIALEELENSNQPISQETVQSIAEVLSLDIIDQQLMQDLGEFLYQISKRKRLNFDLISNYCQQRSGYLVTKLNERLSDVTNTFELIRQNISPGKLLNLVESQSPSQSSAFEEEKHGDMMIIDTSSANPLQATQIKGSTIKLPEEAEKQLKAQLRVHEDSEILLRIFKLFNLFFEKFSTDKEQQQKDNEEMKVDEQIQTEGTNAKEVVSFIKVFYQEPQLSEFVKYVSDTLKIVFKTNLDISEGVSNLIFCVFASFYPELYESIQNEEEQNKKESADKTKSEGKFKVRMIELGDTAIQSKEKFTLFRNTQYFTNRIEELSTFCLTNKRIINKLIKQKTSLFVNELEGLIKHMPNLLDFDNKRAYFKKELAKMKRNQGYDQIQLFIRRDDIFMDSYAQLGIRSAAEMKGRLHISFTGERGQDAGGLTRDFFVELSREMFNPNYSLFVLSSSGSTYAPNPKSAVERDHLRYFKFIGRVLGKALFDDCLLECYFVKSLYKIITGEPLTFLDLEDFDNEFYNNLKWCIENDILPLMATFVVETDYFGVSKEVELIEGGRNIAVTNENKKEYIEKLTYFKLYKQVQEQTDSFLEGFYELIPKELVSIFNYKELELLISGLPNFDITDLKNNTEYNGYSANSPQVMWLWEVLESFENSERAEFLQFVTGSSKIPLDGFKGLMGMRGPQKFTICKIKSDDIMRLPSGHTCFNQIDLPEYPSKEILHERLLTAIKETKGFGFA